MGRLEHAELTPSKASQSSALRGGRSNANCTIERDPSVRELPFLKPTQEILDRLDGYKELRMEASTLRRDLLCCVKFRVAAFWILAPGLWREGLRCHDSGVKLEGLIRDAFAVSILRSRAFRRKEGLPLSQAIAPPAWS